VAEKYVTKGRQLYIEGKIKTRSYDDKDGNKRYITEIVADVMQMLGTRSDNQNNDRTESQYGGNRQEPETDSGPDEPETDNQGDDDLPF
jgi:single-strand DNA-binding protein